MEEPKNFIFNSKLECLDYPVGLCIIENIPLIEIMAAEFMGIREYTGKKVNIICRGSSGAIIAAIFTQKIPNMCKIVHVKKPGEDSHNSSTDLWYDNAINIIVDDQISSGGILNAIWEYMSERHGGFKVDCVIVGGESRWYRLLFTPDNFICMRK